MKIAFGYKCGVGKDEAVRYLKTIYGGEKISIAKPIYDILHYAQKITFLPFEKDRKFLQLVGDWGRNIDKNIWIDLALSNIQEENAYISDLRFINELEILKQNNWICIKINRVVDSSRIGNGNVSHISENELDLVPNSYWDYIIDNNGSLEDFHEKIEQIYSYLIKINV